MGRLSGMALVFHPESAHRLDPEYPEYRSDPGYLGFHHWWGYPSDLGYLLGYRSDPEYLGFHHWWGCPSDLGYLLGYRSDPEYLAYHR